MIIINQVQLVKPTIILCNNNVTFRGNKIKQNKTND